MRDLLISIFLILLLPVFLSLWLVSTLDTSVEVGSACGKFQPCQWMDWQGWGVCDESCGGGVRVRKRGLCCDGLGFPSLDECLTNCSLTRLGMRHRQGCGELCEGGGQYQEGGCVCTGDRFGKCCQHDLPNVTDCEVPPSISNGWFSGDSFNLGDTINYYCKYRHSLVDGNATLLCDSSDSGEGVQWQGTVPTCNYTGICSNNTCLQHGECMDDGDNYYCVCDYGYYGDRCQSFVAEADCTICDWTQWGSWDTCSYECGGGQDARRRMLCCDEKFTLRNCFKHCQKNKADWRVSEGCNQWCYNNATYHNTGCRCDNITYGACCENTITQQYDCDLPQSLDYGSYMGHDFNFSGSIGYYCNDGYIMTSGDRSHICVPYDDEVIKDPYSIARGYWNGTLPKCTYVAHCSSMPCLHSGVCIDGLDNYTCLCTNGWTGDRCQENVTQCFQCTWRDWEPWPKCNSTCGGRAMRERKRTGHDCCVNGDSEYVIHDVHTGESAEWCEVPCKHGGESQYPGCKCVTGTYGQCCESVVTCLAPQSVENGHHTGENFTYGNTVTYSCDDYYNMSAGQQTITCDLGYGYQGYWEGHLPICTYVSPCTSDSCHNGGTCEDHQNGTYTCVCLDGWNGLHCLHLMLCDIPEIIEHGHFTPINYNGFGARVTYSCAEKYQLSRDAVRVCNTTHSDSKKLSWSGELPHCKDMQPPVCTRCPGSQTVYTTEATAHVAWNLPDCHDPHGSMLITSFTNARKLYSHGKHKEVVTALKTSNNMSASCEFYIIVLGAECADPPTIVHGSYSSSGVSRYTSGVKIEYKCESGYELVGERTLVCSGEANSLQWNRDPPTCKDIQPPVCDEPCPKNMTVYMLEESKKLIWQLPRCHDPHRTKVMTFNKGRVIETTQPNPMLSHDEHRTYTVGEHKEIIEIVKLSNKMKIICELYISIKRGECSPPVTIENGSNNSSGGVTHYSGATVHYSCDSGYVLEGKGTLNCAGNANNLQWAGEVPSCKDMRPPLCNPCPQNITTHATASRTSTVSWTPPHCVDPHGGTVTSYNTHTALSPNQGDNETVVSDKEQIALATVEREYSVGMHLEVITAVRQSNGVASSCEFYVNVTIGECGQPPPIDNGRAYSVHPTYTYGSVLHHVCADGYRIDGRPIKCLGDPKSPMWIGELPTCTMIESDERTTPLSTVYTQTTTEQPTTIRKQTTVTEQITTITTRDTIISTLFPTDFISTVPMSTSSQYVPEMSTHFNDITTTLEQIELTTVTITDMFSTEQNMYLKPESPDSSPLIAGSGGGGVLFLLLAVIIVVYLVWRIKHRKSKTDGSRKEPYDKTQNGSKSSLTDDADDMQSQYKLDSVVSINKARRESLISMVRARRASVISVTPAIEPVPEETEENMRLTPDIVNDSLNSLMPTSLITSSSNFSNLLPSIGPDNERRHSINLLPAMGSQIQQCIHIEINQRNNILPQLEPIQRSKGKRLAKRKGHRKKKAPKVIREEEDNFNGSDNTSLRESDQPSNSLEVYGHNGGKGRRVSFAAAGQLEGQLGEMEPNHSVMMYGEKSERERRKSFPSTPCTLGPAGPVWQITGHS